MSATDPGVRDAVRQLSRAARTLVRAVVGSVGRKRPIAGPADSGPPQEWLDLVAETDPDWLARSQWADRARRRPVRTSRHERRPSVTRVEPVEEPSALADLSPVAERTASEFPRPSTKPSARPHVQVEPDDATATTDEPHHVEQQEPVRRQPRRLLPVDPPAVVAASADDDLPQPVRPTAPGGSRATTRPRGDTGPVVATVAPSAVDWPALPVPDAGHARHLATPQTVEASSPYSPLDALLPVPQPAVPEPAQPVRTVPERRHLSAPSLVHTVEPPSQLIRQSAPPGQPLRPTAAAASVWPELPRTESLDETATHAGGGLAANIWRTDGATPDTLTTAQRRS